MATERVVIITTIKVATTVARTYDNVFNNASFLAKASLGPLMVALLIDFAATERRIWGRGSYVYSDDTPIGQWIFLFLAESLFLLPLIAFVPALVAFHKRLEDPYLEAAWIPSLRDPVPSYLTRCFLGAVLYFLPVVSGFLIAVSTWTPWIIFSALVISHAIGLYLVSRITMIYPAMACGQRIGLTESWHMTGRSKWKIFATTLAVTSPLLAIYLAVLASLYLPVLTHSAEMTAQEFGILITAKMYESVWYATPVLFLIALAFTSCVSEIYKKLSPEADIAEVF